MDRFLVSLIAGGLAGCTVDLVMFPLDSFKTKIQNKQPLVFSLSAIYKGLSWSVAGSFPCAAVFWAAYTISKLILASIFGDSYILDFICAIIGSFCSSSIRCPFEFLKTQMITGKFNNFHDVQKNVISKYGVAGLYVGFSALICRELPFDGIQMIFYRVFSSFELLKYSIGPFSIAGGLAGGFTAFVTTPIDVVKTKIMSDSEKFRTVPQTIRIVLESEGIFGFWKGWKIRVMMITIGGWIFFGMFNLLNEKFS